MRRMARRLRQARMVATALRHRYQPINAHIVPIRRCNLACAYCNEFDDHSPPVPLADMVLQWLFVTGRCSRQFRSAAGWLLGAR